MTSMPLLGRQVEVSRNLPTIGLRMRREVIVPAGCLRRDEVGFSTVRCLIEIVTVVAKAGFQKFATGKIMLISNTGLVNRFANRRRCLLWIEWRQAGILVVRMVVIEAGGQNIARGEVALHFGDVADPPESIAILSRGQFGNHNVVVFAVSGIE